MTLKHIFCGALALFTYNHGICQAQAPVVVKDINNNNSAEISEIKACNGKLFFTANDGSGLSAWVTDGTPGNTISLNTNGGRDYNEYNGKTYFIAKNNSNYDQLWVTDGTPTGTTQLAEINAKGNGVIDIYAVANNKLFFRGVDSLHGSELWATDGTALGTQLVADIRPDTLSGLYAGYNSYIVYNHRIFFAAYEGSNGIELFVSDGTAGGTFMYQDINSGAGNSNPTNFSAINGKLYYTATNHWGRELWVLDDATGTTTVQNLEYSNTSSNPGPLSVFNSKMYFIGGPSAPAIQNLYLTNATSAGTVKLVDSVNNMVNFSGHIYYGKSKGIVPGQGQGLHYALYKTVGDVGSPQLLVSNLEGGNSYTAPYNFTACNGKLYFLQKYDGLPGIEGFAVNDLWVHDPALNTTELIMSAANPSNEAYIFTNTGITAYNNNIYFKGLEQEGEELYTLGDAPVGISAIKETQAMELYPNPTLDKLQVRLLNNTDEIESITITDTQGKIMTEQSAANISVANYAPGIYYLHLQTTKGIRQVQRFVKN